MDRHAPEHRITVELGDDLLMARMDARLMVQVVINLVNNAIKYTPPGSNIVLSAARRGDMVEVRVADDGPGVGPEAKSKIFDMFYTANNDRGDGRRGLGLGALPLQVDCDGPRRHHIRRGQRAPRRRFYVYAAFCGGESH